MKTSFLELIVITILLDDSTLDARDALFWRHEKRAKQHLNLSQILSAHCQLFQLLHLPEALIA